MNEKTIEIPRQEEILEIEEEIDNYETVDTDMEKENNNDNVENRDGEITRVDTLNQNDEEKDLGRGKRKKSRNPCYLIWTQWLL